MCKNQPDFTMILARSDLCKEVEVCLCRSWCCVLKVALDLSSPVVSLGLCLLLKDPESVFSVILAAGTHVLTPSGLQHQEEETLIAY